MKNEGYQTPLLGECTTEQLSEKVSEIREALIERGQNHTIHYSSSLGAIELIVALHRYFGNKDEHFFFDTGHQTFAHKFITNPDKLTHGIQQDGFNYASNGQSGNILASALAFAKTKRTSVVLIGDASFQTGISFEMLNYVSRTDEIKIFVNDNQMSISSYESNWKKYWNDLDQRRNFFESFGWSYFETSDGNNVKKLASIVGKVSKKTGPVLCWVKTIKGFGDEKAVNDSLGNLHYSRPKPTSESDTTVSDTLMKHLSLDQGLVVINPGMISGTNSVNLKSNFASRFYDVGISEDLAVGMIRGFSLAGSYPIVNIYSCFLSRTVSQLTTDLNRKNLNGLIIINRAKQSSDGADLNGTYHLQLLSLNPLIKVHQPSTQVELEKLLVKCLTSKKGLNAIVLP